MRGYKKFFFGNGLTLLKGLKLARTLELAGELPRKPPLPWLFD